MTFLKFLGSLPFAIILIAAVALSVIISTFIELPFIIPALLTLFFINILFAALRRYPFKLKHIPFLITHLGLLMIIAGCMVKHIWGKQGVLSLLEGSAAHMITFPGTYALHMEKQDGTSRCIPLPKPQIPHATCKIDPFIKDGMLQIEGLLHVPLLKEAQLSSGVCAVESEEPQKLWAHLFAQETKVIIEDKSYSLKELVDRGEATLNPLTLFSHDISTLPCRLQSNPFFLFVRGPLEDHLFFVNALGETKHAVNPPLYAFEQGFLGYGACFESFVSKATQVITPSEEGQPAITLHIAGRDQTLIYDPTGYGMKWPSQDGAYLLRFQSAYEKMPLHVRLREARKINYEGTNQAASYEADLLIDGKDEVTISMNRVFEKNGYRLYLSNILTPNHLGAKRATFAVNFDPAKYSLTYPGVFLVCLGIILLFYRKSCSVSS